MRINYSCIFWLVIVLLAFQSANGQSETADKSSRNILATLPDSRVENLKKQAGELFEAYKNGDIGTYIQLSHPKMFNREFSRENLAEVLKYVFEFDFAPYGNFHSSVESPNELIEVDNQLFGIVPIKLEGENPLKDKKAVSSSVVGISDDNGVSWKFFYGNSLVFNERFPNVAGRVQVPNERRFVNDKEQ